MKYRVAVNAMVERVGVVEIDAKDEQEARAYVHRLSRRRQWQALNIQWTGNSQPGSIEVVGIEEA